MFMVYTLLVSTESLLDSYSGLQSYQELPDHDTPLNLRAEKIGYNYIYILDL